MERGLIIWQRDNQKLLHKDGLRRQRTTLPFLFSNQGRKKQNNFQQKSH
jgi:hypothetical protein